LVLLSQFINGFLLVWFLDIVLNLSTSREREKLVNKNNGYVTMEGSGKCEGIKNQIRPQFGFVS